MSRRQKRKVIHELLVERVGRDVADAVKPLHKKSLRNAGIHCIMNTVYGEASPDRYYVTERSFFHESV